MRCAPGHILSKRALHEDVVESRGFQAEQFSGQEQILFPPVSTQNANLMNTTCSGLMDPCLAWSDADRKILHPAQVVKKKFKHSIL